jgi:hypothetical protein
MLIDANLLLYAVHRQSPFHVRARSSPAKRSKASDTPAEPGGASARPQIACYGCASWTVKLPCEIVWEAAISAAWSAGFRQSVVESMP